MGEEKKSSASTWAGCLIVAVILFLMAAIAIPNFLGFCCKAKQSEARQNLGAIHTAMAAYFSANNTYPDEAVIDGINHDCWKLMNWGPSGQTRYTYQCGSKAAVIMALSYASRKAGCTKTKSETFSHKTRFLVAATGNIDVDTTCCDEWAINEKKVMKNQIAGPDGWGASMNDCKLDTCPKERTGFFDWLF